MTADTTQPTIEELLARIEGLEQGGQPRRGLRRLLGGKALGVGAALLAASVSLVPSLAGAAPPQVFWSLAGNAGTTAANFLGTTDNNPLVIKTNNTTAMTVGADQNVTVNKSLNVVGGLQENGTQLSSEYVSLRGQYQNPFWLTSLDAGKLTGTLPASTIPDLSGTYVKTDGSNATGTWGISTTGNAGTVTNGVYTTGDQTIGGTKTFGSTIQGDISGNAGGLTGVKFVYQTATLRPGLLTGVIALCPSGSSAMGGGGEVDSGSTGAYLLADAPEMPQEGTPPIAWHAVAYDPSTDASNGIVIAYAICAALSH